MKGVRGYENQRKLKERLPEIQSMLYENQSPPFFIFHSSLKKALPLTGSALMYNRFCPSVTNELSARMRIEE
jgi:hypothetical protein